MADTKEKTKISRPWIVPICLISQGLAVLTHLYLTDTHFRLKFGILEGKSLCNISDFLNCDAVNSSAYSELFGLPVALWGFVTNLVLALVICGLYLSQNKSFFKTLGLALSGVTVAASVIMGAISLTLISALCIFCLTAYALSFLTFFLLTKATGSFDFPSLYNNKGQLKYTIGFLISIPIVTVLINNVTVQNMVPGLDQAVVSSIEDWKAGKDLNFSSAKGLTKGADLANAKMVIVEFADFQCGHCEHAYPILRNFVKSHSDVALIFQSFPLDGNCNMKVEHKGDGKSCELAKAVYCAWKQSKGWEVHDWAYENFGHADLSELMQLAPNMGINVEEFRKCRESAETLQAIVDQAKLGADAGVMGTPSIFVNGRLLPRGSFTPVLEAAYNEIKRRN